MGKIRTLAGLVVALSVCVQGCGGSADAQKKRVRELEEELTQLQNSHDRLEERVTSLEVSRPDPRAEPKATAASNADSNPAPAEERALPATLERPPLKVFKLGPNAGAPPPAAAPSAEEAPGEEASDEPRPVIRGQGQRIEKTVAAKAAPAPKAAVPATPKAKP
jgi:hypothetical protein